LKCNTKDGVEAKEHNKTESLCCTIQRKHFICSHDDNDDYDDVFVFALCFGVSVFMFVCLL